MSVISLAGKTALVTGSTSGIGWEVLKALAGAGANVAMHGLGDPAKLSDMRSKLASDAGVKVGSPRGLLGNCLDPTYAKARIAEASNLLHG